MVLWMPLIATRMITLLLSQNLPIQIRSIRGSISVTPWRVNGIHAGDGTWLNLGQAIGLVVWDKYHVTTSQEGVNGKK